MTDLDNQAKPTIVLVHGAFAESSSWEGVIRRLRAQGYTALAAANPLRSLSADAEYVAGILRALKRPVVLVGHSYGGAVITRAAREQPNVRALVYAAGFAPAEGEDAIELSLRFPGSTLGESLWPVPLGDGSSDLYIEPSKFSAQFAADVDEERAVLMAATQRPVRDVALKEALVGSPAWSSIPSWFVVAELDRNIPAALQRFMAERAGARGITVVDGASHAVGVSRPGEVADTVLRAALAVS